jgi:hypothetical protein
MSEGLFISYRRSDTQGSTGRLADHLRQNGFGGEGDMFLDIDSRIPPGVDFRAVINETLAGCDLVIIVMGRHWLDASDSKGRRRLDRTSDTHRLEVAAALNSAARVIPVLVEGASHPSEEDLPDDLKDLAFLQSWSLGERNYAGDVETLANRMLDARRQMEDEREQAAAEEAEREQAAAAEQEPEDRERAEAAAAEQEPEDRERAEAAAAEKERERLAAEAVAANKERQDRERAEAAAAEEAERAAEAKEERHQERGGRTHDQVETTPGIDAAKTGVSSRTKLDYGLQWLKTHIVWIGGLVAVAAVALIVGTVFIVADTGGQDTGGQIELYQHDDVVVSAVFSPEGDRIVTASWDDTAGVWDPDGTLLSTLEGHTNSVNSAVFNPEGDRIVTASSDDTAGVWDPDGTLLATLNHDNNVLSAVFNPDGDRIVTAADDNTARVWDPDGTLLATLEGHTDGVASAVFSPDGTRIVTASWDGTAKVWEPDGTLLTTLDHGGEVLSAAFNPDGDRIVTASTDGTAKVWEPDGTLLATLEGHTDGVRSAVFSPVENLIVTASWDDTARLWFPIREQ